jgi:hypothetical protein
VEKGWGMDKERKRGREEGDELGKKKKGKCPYNDQRTIQNFSDHTLLQVRDIEELTSLGARYQSLGVEKGEEGVGDR